MDLNPTESIAYYWPELVLGLTALAVWVIDLFEARKDRLGEVALFGAALSVFLASRLVGWGEGWIFDRMLIVDGFAIFFKILLGLATLAVLWMSLESNEIRHNNEGEYYGLILCSAIAMYTMAAAANLLMAYLGLEFVSLTSYILTGYLRRNRRSGEAALKYLIYGGVASGAMIYGMSWIYGLTGSMDYAHINQALASLPPGNQLAVFIALVLIMVGFGYKIAAVPFHMWAPDAYEGAPIPVTTFLAIGSKAAGFALLMRFFYPAISHSGEHGTWTAIAGVDWPQMLLVLCMVTMTLGNLAALSQTNVKRLLAYSSIAHAGYVLMGFVLLTDDGLRAMLFYLLAYYLMNLGAFLVVLVVANSTGRDDVASFRGLAWRGGIFPAVAMAIFLFSLTGLPPFVGFVGKFFLFAAVVKADFYLLALVGLANSVVALYYYARIVRTMFLDFPTGDEPTVEVGIYNGFLMGVLASATVVFGIYWTPLITFADRSIRFFRG
ncbi:MAG: NADH-quinone oxidoreductase subunit [Candidatus Binatota bacterium]|nr:NADH-quinone oxidoreductase subunit [Candidatus Binatota bacterium]